MNELIQYRFVLKDSSGRILHSPTGELPRKDISRILNLSSESFIPVERAKNPGVTGLNLKQVMRSLRPRPNNNDRRLMLRILSESSSKKKTLRKIFLKFLWDQLNDLEIEAMLLLALEVNDLIIFEAFRAFRILESITLLRSRVNAYCILKDLKPFSRREFLSSKCFSFKVEELDIFDQQPRVKSYSGWSRHQNDQGSINPSTHPFEYSEPLEPEDILDERILLREYLSVGRLSPPENESSLKSAIRIAETEKFSQILRKELLNETLH